MSYKKNIFVAGHKGMLGSAIVRKLEKENVNLFTVDKKKLNLLDIKKLKNFLKKNKIHEIYLCAAKVGGILANNNYPADFIYENSQIGLNVIKSAFDCRVRKVLNFGSSCIFPKLKKILREDDLLTGKLEKTNEGYAIAKILILKLCEKFNTQYGKSHKVDFRSVMPCNLFGPNDNYAKNKSHVIPALIRKFVEAKINKNKSVKIWGTGKPKREFLHVDDLADASIKIMKMSKKKYKKIINNSESFINIGYGKDYEIKLIVNIISKAVNYDGKIIYDRKFPDGTPKKLMDISKIKKIGWKPKKNFKKALTDLTRTIYKKSIVKNKFQVN